MNTITRACLAALVFLAGSTAFSQGTYTLRYGFGSGKTYLYAGRVEMKMTQEMMGQEMKSSTTTDMITHITGDAQTPDGTTSLIISLDSLTVAVKSPRRDTTMVMTELLGKRNKVVLAADGKVKGREEIDTIPNLGQMRMRGMGRGISTREAIRFHHLPEEKVSTGGTWKSSVVDTTDAMGGKIYTTTAMSYTLLGEKEVGGVPALQISYTGETSVEGKGSMMGSEMFVEGKGQVSGTFAFDARRGLIVVDEMKSEQDMTVAITGQQNMTMPMSQSSAITQRLLAK